MATIPQYVPATAIDAVDLDPSVYVDPRTGKALPILVTGTITTSPPADPVATAALQTTGNTSLAALEALLTPKSTAPVFVRTNVSGATTAGQLYSLTIYNSGTTNGTVGGQTLYPGEWVAFNAPLGDTLAAVSYVPGTEFTITTVGLAA